MQYCTENLKTKAHSYALCITWTVNPYYGSFMLFSWHKGNIKLTELCN